MCKAGQSEGDLSIYVHLCPFAADYRTLFKTIDSHLKKNEPASMFMRCQLAIIVTPPKDKRSDHIQQMVN